MEIFTSTETIVSPFNVEHKTKNKLILHFVMKLKYTHQHSNYQPIKFWFLD